ncbi:MAG: hypothetical protein RLZZ26_55 [Candidatus Parcubacteria bacterium]
MAIVTGSMAIVGLAVGVAGIASAQTSSTTSPVVPIATIATTSGVDTPEAGDVADVPGVAEKTHGHAPLGGDGVVTSITGTTIVVGEESDEGGASYTIDASKATVTNNGAAATLADVKVGEKIFVQGTTSGTNVVATSISVGGPGGHKEEANDVDSTTGQ